MHALGMNGSEPHPSLPPGNAPGQAAASTTGQPASSSVSGWADETASKPRASCVKHFDALWFCYSPVHQMQEVYRYGTTDDCMSHWSALYRCLKRKTKFADQVPHEEPSSCLWQLRTPDEANQFWQAEFGHLDADGSGVETATSDEHKDRGGAGVV